MLYKKCFKQFSGFGFGNQSLPDFSFFVLKSLLSLADIKLVLKFLNKNISLMNTSAMSPYSAANNQQRQDEQKETREWNAWGKCLKRTAEKTSQTAGKSAINKSIQ